MVSSIKIARQRSAQDAFAGIAVLVKHVELKRRLAAVQIVVHLVVAVITARHQAHERERPWPEIAIVIGADFEAPLALGVFLIENVLQRPALEDEIVQPEPRMVAPHIELTGGAEPTAPNRHCETAVEGGLAKF